jgi:hypothetical protein
MMAMPVLRGQVRFDRFRRKLRKHRNELLGYLTVTLIVGMLGIGLGLIWWWWAPKLALLISPRGALITKDQPEEFIASDGRFAIIAGVAGVVLGLAAWFLRRWRGPGMVLALGVGSFASSWVMWKLGEEVGRVNGRDLISAASMGQRVSVPIVDLRSTGLLCLQSLLIVLTYIVCTSWSKSPDLRIRSGAEVTPTPLNLPAGYPVAWAGPVGAYPDSPPQQADSPGRGRQLPPREPG